jgi:hypothetical protein
MNGAMISFRILSCILVVIETIQGLPFPKVPFSYRQLSEKKINTLQSCMLPTNIERTLPHTTNDTAWFGFPKIGSSTIRSVVKFLNGTDSDQQCNADCVKKLNVVMFSRDPVDRFISAWSESERVCAQYHKYSQPPFNETIKLVWDKQNWGSWHKVPHKYLHGDDIESRTIRVQERFTAFVKSFLQWKSSQLEDFPKEAGLCEIGIVRVLGHFKSQMLYLCARIHQNTAKFCGENTQYIGEMKTLSEEIRVISGVDLDALQNTEEGKPIFMNMRKSAAPLNLQGRLGVTEREFLTNPTSPSAVALVSKFPKPQIPSEYMRSICILYRNDFCCLGYPIPEQCADVCEFYVTAKSGGDVRSSSNSIIANKPTVLREHWVNSNKYSAQGVYPLV